MTTSKTLLTLALTLALPTLAAAQQQPDGPPPGVGFPGGGGYPQGIDPFGPAGPARFPAGGGFGSGSGFMAAEVPRLMVFDLAEHLPQEREARERTLDTLIKLVSQQVRERPQVADESLYLILRPDEGERVAETIATLLKIDRSRVLTPDAAEAPARVLTLEVAVFEADAETAGVLVEPGVSDEELAAFALERMIRTRHIRQQVAGAFHVRDGTAVSYVSGVTPVVGEAVGYDVEVDELFDGLDGHGTIRYDGERVRLEFGRLTHATVEAVGSAGAAGGGGEGGSPGVPQVQLPRVGEQSFAGTFEGVLDEWLVLGASSRTAEGGAGGRLVLARVSDRRPQPPAE